MNRASPFQNERLAFSPTVRAAFVATGLVIACAFILLRSAGLLQPLELYVYGLFLDEGGTPAGNQRVSIVTIDDTDIENWGWPIADEKLAEIVRTLDDAGASVIGIDIYRDRPIPPGSIALEALFSKPNVIAISKLASDGGLIIDPPKAAAERNQHGFTDIPIDPDGVARRALLLVSDQGSLRLSFALRLALAALGKTNIEPVPDNPGTILLGQTAVPRLQAGFGGYTILDDLGYQILMDFSGLVRRSDFFSASALLSNPDTAARLRGKIVIIGTSSDAVKDLFVAPVAERETARLTYGVQMHAAVVSQLLRYATGSTMPTRALPRRYETTAILAVGIISAAAAIFARTMLLSILLGPVAMTAIFAFTASALTNGWWLPTVPLTLTWLVTFLLVFSAVSLATRRQRRVMARLFSAHMPASLANEVWHNQEAFLAGSHPKPLRLFATVLFADLAGSTKFGGSAAPDEFMAWISRFLERMSEAAREKNGLIEKFTGDGIMVVFGAPLPHGERADQIADANAACRCAIEMVAAVGDLNRQSNTGPDYRIRIGIHTGIVLGGTVGTTGNMQYTVIGDAANLAARIEAFGKSVLSETGAANIACISEATKLLVEGSIPTAEAGVLLHDDGEHKIPVHMLMLDDQPVTAEQ